MGKYKNVDGEIFKDIEGYNGDYQVSNFGRIKSFKRYNNGKILTQNKNSEGYLYIGLYKNRKSKPKNKLIHDLMFESFNNYKIKKGEVIHHIDFTKNNTLDNFQLMTLKEHTSFHNSGKKCPEHSKRISGENNPCFGRTGENNPRSILIEQNVIAMKSFWEAGIKISNKLLAKWYGVHPATISNIKNRKKWKHII